MSVGIAETAAAHTVWKITKGQGDIRGQFLQPLVVRTGGGWNWPKVATSVNADDVETYALPLPLSQSLVAVAL
jgi:hypothetical protein